MTTTAKIILSQSYGLYVGPSSAGVRKIYGADSSNGTYTRMASYAMIPDNDSDDCWQVRPWNGGFGDSYMTVMHGGKIGMGTNSPTHNLHVNGVVRVENILLGVQDDQINGYNNSAIYLNYGSSGNVSICGGSTMGNVGIRTSAPTHNCHINGVTRINNILLGVKDDQINVMNGGTLYISHSNGTGNVCICTGSTTGGVGIGTMTVSYKLHVAGSIYATGEITALSDMRKKLVMKNVYLDVNTIAEAPSFLYYKRNDKEDNDLHVGSSAQYWEKVLPEAVKRDKEGTLSMSYGVVALVAAISTAKKVQEHERRIAELEHENKELKVRLRRLNRYGKQ